MAKPRLTDVISHWSKLFENFDASPTDFYKSLRSALETREIPSLSTREITYQEGGPFTQKRVYLRISREELTFDVCAAPFGTGFFFSWWLSEQRPRFGVLYATALVVVSWLSARYFLARLVLEVLFRQFYAQLGTRWNPSPQYFQTVYWGTFVGTCVLVILVLALLARLGVRRAESIVIAMPLVGWLYRRLFRPDTYYRIDTIGMYQAAAHAAVLEVIDGLTTAKGLRALNEDERKPIMRTLLRK